MAELNSAVRSGDIESVKRLVNRSKVDVFYNGICPLMLACQCGYVEIVKLLVEEGADVNLQNAYGSSRWSALMKAVAFGHVEIAKVLVECGAKIALENTRGESALVISCRSGNKNTEVIKLLLQQGYGMVDVVVSLIVACDAGYVEVVKTLLEYSTEPVNVVFTPSVETNLARMYRGWTALTKASAQGHNLIVDILLNNGADIDLKNRDGYSALMVAILKSKQETATLLVERGANLNLTTYHRDTALMLTARTGNIQIARLLLDRGASIDHQNYTGETCLIAACREQHREISKLLIERNANVNLHDDRGISAVFLEAKTIPGRSRRINSGEPTFQMIELLLGKGAEVNCISEEGKSALNLLEENRQYIPVSMHG